MSTLFDLGYSRIDFFDVSGTWTCPLDIDEILLIGSGGGGGGAGAGLRAVGVGNNGTAGGATTMTGAGFTTQTFTGGAAGVGASQYLSLGGGNGNGFGRGPSGYTPSSTATISHAPGGDWSEAIPILGNTNSFFFPGGNGGGSYVYADVSANPKFINKMGSPGSLANAGQGWIGAVSSVCTGAYSGAGAGGAAMGISRRVKVRPGTIYTLTIGSGGDGGPCQSSFTGPPGGGGAGGFIAIAYNQEPKNAA